jgi:sphingomyelin phosphodiesterase
VFDSQTYIANLDQASSWDASGSSPNWHLEYSARETYGAYVPIAPTAPLSASWWHNVTTVFEEDDAAFQKYWNYRSKSAGAQQACEAGSVCKKEVICDLRAGKSSDACSKGKVSNNHKRDDDAQKEAEADPSGLNSLYRRAEAGPWEERLCGLPNLGI